MRLISDMRRGVELAPLPDIGEQPKLVASSALCRQHLEARRRAGRASRLDVLLVAVAELAEHHDTDRDEGQVDELLEEVEAIARVWRGLK